VEIGKIGEIKKIKTACQACHCECGVIVEVRDGRVVHLEGDSDHPENRGIMCPKGLSYIDLVYHTDRLRYPRKRVGKRGEGKFERIGRDEALDAVAREFNQIREKYGPEAIGFAWNDGPRTYCIPYTALLFVHRAWVILAICFANFFITYSVRLGYGILLPQMSKSLSPTKAQGGLIYSFFSLPISSSHPFLETLMIE